MSRLLSNLIMLSFFLQQTKTTPPLPIKEKKWFKSSLLQKTQGKRRMKNDWQDCWGGGNGEGGDENGGMRENGRHMEAEVRSHWQRPIQTAAAKTKSHYKSKDLELRGRSKSKRSWHWSQSSSLITPLPVLWSLSNQMTWSVEPYSDINVSNIFQLL